MDFDFYQRESFKTAKYPEKGTGSVAALTYTALGLGESGEVQGKVKKILRDCGGKISPEMKDAIVKEMGDVFWYLASLATELNVSLSEVAIRNLEKLFDRDARGVIGGSGDNR